MKGRYMALTKFQKNRKIFGEFFGHLVIGALMAVALFVFGGFLHILVDFAGEYFKNDFFVLGLKLLENVLFLSDIVFIAWWTIYSTYKAGKELIK